MLSTHRTAGVASTVKPKEEIKEKHQSGQPINTQPINIVNITNNISDNILVNHIPKEYKFILVNGPTTIGYFTIGQIYKFINPNIDGYLIDVDLGVSIDIIRKYLICQTDDNEFKLISHLESPITGNIDILVKVYQDVINYEKILENEYLHLNEINKEIVITNNKKFIYEILTFIVKLFSIFSSSNTQISHPVRELITKYTIGCVYKLNNLIKNDLDDNIVNIMNIKTDLNNIKKIRENITNQLDELKQLLITENSKIDNIIENLTKPQSPIKGGNINNSYTQSYSQTPSNTETNTNTNISKSISQTLSKSLTSLSGLTPYNNTSISTSTIQKSSGDNKDFTFTSPSNPLSKSIRLSDTSDYSISINK